MGVTTIVLGNCGSSVLDVGNVLQEARSNPHFRKCGCPGGTWVGAFEDHGWIVYTTSDRG